jgi:hypothetical protein
VGRPEEAQKVRHEDRETKESKIDQTLNGDHDDRGEDGAQDIMDSRESRREAESMLVSVVSSSLFLGRICAQMFSSHYSFVE